ncbi:Transposase [Pseudomonas panipatensis]|uniref:Transposase n=1 Tax=Pseudomonas panipatensis TaxID=428992 RepID=A0A1G8MNU8_9PSED|nr:Transposase [Pseudomonas panipatensis]SMP77616.1 Transposase [Pseudomonas panipatensis]
MADVLVDELNLGRLDFNGVVQAETGRPAYHPCVLLKIYIYGYLNRIQSSRRREREAQRNLELMWLTVRLTPDFKTIANFRKAIRGVLVLCQQLSLLAEALVAIDGSKFKAVNNRDRNFTSAKLQRRMEEIESNIGRYFSVLETADRQEQTASSSGRMPDTACPYLDCAGPPRATSNVALACRRRVCSAWPRSRALSAAVCALITSR